jgi:hypothetical protein
MKKFESGFFSIVIEKIFFIKEIYVQKVIER